MPTDRSYDLVLWGATGFTGKLVAEYLTQRYGAIGPKLRWAIAGRDREKLELARKQLAAFDPRALHLPILIGRSDDPASLHAIAKQTVMVCAVAGPFAKLGSEMVAACVGERTHYCDITGEVQWVNEMVARHHETARKQGTRIVHCCGFDSVPSDLGVFVLQELARERFGAPAALVKSVVSAKAGGVSGGTLASMFHAFEQAERDPSVFEVMANPLALCRDGAASQPSVKEPRGAQFDEDLGGWLAPFVMAAVNTRIVHRSSALMGNAYGLEFSYIERIRTGRGVRAALGANAVAGGMLAFQGLLKRPTARRLIQGALPKPGGGPSAAKRAGSYFSVDFLGRVVTPTGPRTLRSKFAAKGDPGYGETAKMVAEAALCLALDGGKLAAQGGVLTPASAMGRHLVDRLRGTGFTIEASEGELRV
jgi:short subunit dehydrogenase-like uncharacterized protein